MEGSNMAGLIDNFPEHTEVRKKIPFDLGASMMLRSLANFAHRAKTKIIGVVHHDIIMIENPVFEVNDRLSASVGDFLCTYLLEGCVFRFTSRFNKDIHRNIVAIDYPDYYEVQQLRKHPRIKVILEVDVVLGQQRIAGDVKDVSEGGCSLELPSMIPIVKGTEIVLTFALPDNQLIEGMRGEVMNMEYLYAWRKTQVGISFQGPQSELEKIRKFCQMCAYFRV
ncbi:MAG: PilZ domain-containing protein [Desulfobacteraceae bacterium]|nr:PilZ domain-containing protein [Desulfobacteraceae bacterium]